MLPLQNNKGKEYEKKKKPDKIHFILVTQVILYQCQTAGIDNCTKVISGHRTEKVSFISNPKQRQYQRMLKLPHNCTHLTC